MVQTLDQHVDTNGRSGLPAGLNSDDVERVQDALESPGTRRRAPVAGRGETKKVAQLVRAIDFDQQDRSPATRLKRVRLGCFAVPATLVDLDLSVPITQRQVVQPGEPWPRGVDRIGSLLLIGIEAVDCAMCQANADQSGIAVMIVHPCRGVIEGTTMLERSREKHGNITLDDRALQRVCQCA